MKNPKLIVKVNEQIAVLYFEGQPSKTYPVSTAKNGLGCENGSYCTPTGLLRVVQKIGEAMPIGTVFSSRIPTGENWSLDLENPLSESKQDLILTRILWLKGAEESNSNTLERYIYLHGTNHEDLLGKPASHGCIRFSNKDIVELFDFLPIGSEIYIV